MEYFQIYDSAFHALIGDAPQLDLLLEKDYPFAHEAGVFIPEKNELFITSNQLVDGEGHRRVEISKIILTDDGNVQSEEISCPEVEMANGGVNYGQDKMLICAQGSGSAPSGLYLVDITPPYKTELVVAGFHGRPFNAVNDVVVHSDGSIWFTDPCYGFDGGFKSKPRLPNQVYRYKPTTRGIRAMADGFGRPNGICFSPDEKTVYVTDTDWTRGTGDIDDTRASTIYAFDVREYAGEPFLTNRRLFAFCDTGIPDGIKCDMDGNVYSGCGDGVYVWSPGGTLLGKICVQGGVANFCFGSRGGLFLLNEKRLWRAQLAPTVRGALLKL
ncbi:gluconolactonase [Cladophialophora psammophila CBS 110553]|uniref:Gluconolactonase n=1 Tax=Cladophialophora psammophila CBS 110553 TaxID=1182543 RepID=W9WVU3_9EURO|nr:gluconolactonase [Cladophialophora psammophila CBS 110553]EXJ69185.1 gluconolactonase [Cladophialophora psammophila CBS 110553]